MPDTRTDVLRVSEPITVSPDEDGFIIQIVSGTRTYLFHASAHKVANVNMAVRGLLDRRTREHGGNVKPFAHRAARERKTPRHNC